MLFPQLSRLAARRDFAGLRALIGSGHAPDRAAADPVARRRSSCSRRRSSGSSTSAASSTPSRRQLTAEALFWFAFSLPFSGCQPAAHAHVLLRSSGRGCRPRWRVGSLVVNVVVSLALLQAAGDRRRRARHGDLQRRADRARGALAAPRARRARAAPDAARVRRDARRRGACSAVVAYGVWCGAGRRPRPLAASRQIISVGGALDARRRWPTRRRPAALRIPEARQIVDLFARETRGAPLVT